MKKVLLFALSALMIIMAAIAIIKGLNKECILLCGLATSANCLQDISDRSMRSGLLWYFLIILAVAAGFFVYPLIPIIVSCTVLVGLNLYSYIVKKEELENAR